MLLGAGKAWQVGFAMRDGERSSRGGRLNGEDTAEKCKHRGVELLRPLQGCEVTDSPEQDQFRVGNAAGEIFGVIEFDEFVALALYDHDGQANLSEIARGVIGLGFHHQADGFDKGLEVPAWAIAGRNLSRAG